LPKVADADLAALVNEDVGWLDVAVEHIRRVQELQGAQEIVHHGEQVVLAEVYRVEEHE
jgi:hypothetical protein